VYDVAESEGQVFADAAVPGPPEPFLVDGEG
jgi:hypothetical protein